MYTRGLPFCIPKRVPAVAHLRSARTHFRKSRTSEDVVPFGFCSGGFSSTSSLRSGQRGSTEVERRPLLRGRSFPRERRRVFIRAAQTSLPTHPAQAFRLRLGRQWQQLNRWLLSSSIALPRRLPIPSPVAAPLRTATGGGLYAGAFSLSRSFFEKKFRPFSADFPHFLRMQKAHPQLISTGGNFMRELLKSSRPKLAPTSRKKTLHAARFLTRIGTARGPKRRDRRGWARGLRLYSRAGGAVLLKSESRPQTPEPTDAM